jgi:hypothetical protein
MMKRKMFVLSLLFVIVLCSFGYCQNSASAKQIRRATGRVVDVDWVAGKIVVRTEDFDSGNVDEITFQVPDNTPITRGTDNIDLSDINQSDLVIVEYDNSSLVGAKAITITVQE